LHPIEDVTISIRNDNMYAVEETVSRRHKRSDDRDAAFAVDKAGRVGPISI